MNCPTPIALTWEQIIEVPIVGTIGSHPHVLRRGGFLAPCKRWRCDACGPGKRAEALKLIRAGAQAGLTTRPGQPLRFITLTYPTGVSRSFDRRDDVIASSEDWRRLVQSWRRSGRQLEYVRVLERTKRGRIHIHAITWGDWIPKCTDAGRRARGRPTTLDIKAQWNAAETEAVLTPDDAGTPNQGKARFLATGPAAAPCYCSDENPCIQKMAWAAGFGFVEVRRIRSALGAAAYVAKYLAKQSSDAWPRYARRVSYSRRFADGLTLGATHAAWVAEVRRRLEEIGELEEIPPGVVWYHHRTGSLTGTRAPPRPWLAD